MRKPKRYGEQFAALCARESVTTLGISALIIALPFSDCSCFVPSTLKTCVLSRFAPLDQLLHFSPGASEESFAGRRCRGSPCFVRKVGKAMILPNKGIRKTQILSVRVIKRRDLTPCESWETVSGSLNQLFTSPTHRVLTYAENRNNRSDFSSWVRDRSAFRLWFGILWNYGKTVFSFSTKSSKGTKEEF